MPNQTATTTQTPWIVLDRTAAISGVDSVNGRVGLVTLNSDDALEMGAVLSVNGNIPDPATGNVTIPTGTETSVLYLGEVMHVQSTNVPMGALPADGKQYAKSVYPDLVAALNDGTLTVVTDDVWQAGDFDSFSWGTVDGTETGAVADSTGAYFRVPDVTNRIQNLDLRKLINDDLNTLTADWSGWYYQNIAADATIASHYPVEGLCGTLVVYGNGVGADGSGCTQVFYAANSDDIWSRFYTAPTESTGGTWSAWALPQALQNAIKRIDALEARLTLLEGTVV